MFITENGTIPQKISVISIFCLECILNNYYRWFAGYGQLQKPETTVKDLLHDTKRIQYMSGYLDALQAAMR